MSCKTECKWLACFDPLTIRDLQKCSNSVFVSPMCEYSSVDGYANDWHFRSSRQPRGGWGRTRADGSNGGCSGRTRISPQDLGIWSDDHIPALRRISELHS